VAAYCRRTGRDSLPALDYYVAFNLFRFAAILHGIRGRALRGTAANAQAHRMGELFGRVADLAWEQALAVDARGGS
jgi:aminoglycoside phosphotransferase (APT) family kinase protein